MKSKAVDCACINCYSVNPEHAISDLGQRRCLECDGVVLDVTGLIDYIAYLESGDTEDGYLEE